MRLAPVYSRLAWSIRTIFPLLFLLASGVTGRASCNNKSINSGDATGQVGVAFTYTITVTGTATSFSATGLPPGLSVPDPTNGVISGTPTTAGVYSVVLTVTFTGNCTLTKTVTFTINVPAFVGFRLPDFLMAAGTPNKPRLMLQVGANGGSNRFNATLEVDATGTGTWVPYNHFVGITDTNPNYAFRNSWITDAPLPVRDSGSSTGTPQAFSSAQLTQPQLPAVYMKADPRSTRFGIFQMDTNLDPTVSRIMLSLWPTGDPNVPNSFGGTLGTDVEHVPLRFGGTYYPATMCYNNGPSTSTRTSYFDNDNVLRPADATYPDRTVITTGTATPYDATSAVYRPIMLNRPFRNVAELGYVFRDLPWKTLDLFSQNSADAGLLDVFCIHDGPRATTAYDANGDLGTVVPSMVAGKINLNTQQTGGLQAVLAGAIWDDGLTFSTVSNTGSPTAQNAQTMASNITTATSATPIQNKTELITRAGLPATILPTASNDNQAVKARREVVPRAISSVSQTRVWNLLIDVVAQSGHYKPNATSLQNDFIVEGEQHYWVHVAIDRFTGQVIDKQIEVVNE
jgi:hypothetical protein